jgi:tRNA pseudouridine32 synthase / 23S rRNA pseudouridine746 synthase
VAIEIIAADAAMVVIHKPAGLLSVPGRGIDKQDCASRQVQQQFPDALIVHRLDMATSGLMVFARGIAMQRTLNQSFSERTVAKRYIAIVHGRLPVQHDWQSIDLPIAADWERRPLRVIDYANGKPSLTHWRCLYHHPTQHTSRLELAPVTGRSHQLRVHLQAIGHPIVGDALYAPEASPPQERLYLHACWLALPHPQQGQMVEFCIPPQF